MKKIILITIVALSTGILSSCTKENVKPVNHQIVAGTADKKDIGVGDGGVN